MTSSSECRVVASDLTAALPRVATPDLRTGHWTRHAGVGLGDQVTEDVLGVAAEEARRVAHAQGWSRGWADGMRAAQEAAAEEQARHREEVAAEEARRRAEHVALLDSLREAVREQERRTARAEKAVADQAVAVALGVTEALLGDVAAAVAPADLVHHALVEAGVHDTATVVRVAPLHAAALREETLPEGVTVRADATLSVGDAVVDLGDTAVDLRVGAALERVRDALAGAVP